MKTGVFVFDVMTKKPITVNRDENLVDCANLMGERDVNSLIIKDENNKVLGIVADEDFIRKAMAKNLDPFKTKVEEIMAIEVITIEPDKDLYDAVKLMGDYNIRQLPVVENHKLVGIITVKDIIKVEPAIFEILSGKIRLKLGTNLI
nr:CBS domain-containing protein [Candidatus Woesearchaeota archaeon]